MRVTLFSLFRFNFLDFLRHKFGASSRLYLFFELRKSEGERRYKNEDKTKLMLNLSIDTGKRKETATKRSKGRRKEAEKKEKEKRNKKRRKVISY